MQGNTAASRTALSSKCSLQVHREKSKALFEIINSYRSAKSIPTLTWDDTLYSYCVMHNINMHGSRVKSSDFKLGQGYNENTGHIDSASTSQLMDLWKSNKQEKNNLLFDGVKYSAVAILGDKSESYATQIFTISRPEKSEKVPSMKTANSCASCTKGNTVASRERSAATFRAKTVASTKVRSKTRTAARGVSRGTIRARSGMSAARTGASQRPQSILGLTNLTEGTGQSGSGTVTRAIKNIGQNLGQSFKIGGQSLVSGLKSIGDTFDSSPPRQHHSGGPSTRRRSHAQSSRRSPYGQTRSTFGPTTTMRRGGASSAGRFLGMRNGGGFSSASARNCPICNIEKPFLATYCDTCTNTRR